MPQHAEAFDHPGSRTAPAIGSPRNPLQLNTTASASHAAFGYMSNYTLRLRRKTNYSPQVEGVKMPSEGCAGAFKPFSSCPLWVVTATTP